ncbi:ComF family protein [Pseudoroseomonas globiformis]|uniref:ComF family protein n=2 Tax=Teichococcus globiformis TaxID=2307229 RepID=A0ABV7FZT1_9PROT
MDIAAGRAALRRLGEGVLDAVLPPRCLACGEPVVSHGTLCSGCFAGLEAIGDPQCFRCGSPFVHEGQASTGEGSLGEGFLCNSCSEKPPVYGRARAAYLYNDGSKRLLLPLKHGDRTDLSRPLARRMAIAGRRILQDADLLIPVPLHHRRLLKRRYNQASLLAAELSRQSAVPWAPNLLRRHKRTPPLGPLGAFERREALADAFHLGQQRSVVQGRRVVLVDDVLTSGATVGACATVLLSHGAAGVDVLAAARVANRSLVEGGFDD